MSDRVEKIEEVEEIGRVKKVTHSGRTYYYLNLSGGARSRARSNREGIGPDYILDIRSMSASPEPPDVQEWLELRKTDLARVWREILRRHRPQSRRASKGQPQRRRPSFTWPKELRAALEVLGLQTTSSVAEVRARWRELVKRLHPDRGGPSEEFIRVQEAYEVLASYAQRKASDKHGKG